jgi:hypothetical protein
MILLSFLTIIFKHIMGDFTFVGGEEDIGGIGTEILIFIQI